MVYDYSQETDNHTSSIIGSSGSSIAIRQRMDSTSGFLVGEQINEVYFKLHADGSVGTYKFIYHDESAGTDTEMLSASISGITTDTAGAWYGNVVASTPSSGTIQSGDWIEVAVTSGSSRVYVHNDTGNPAANSTATKEYSDDGSWSNLTSAYGNAHDLCLRINFVGGSSGGGSGGGGSGGSSGGSIDTSAGRSNPEILQILKIGVPR